MKTVVYPLTTIPSHSTSVTMIVQVLAVTWLILLTAAQAPQVVAGGNTEEGVIATKDGNVYELAIDGATVHKLTSSGDISSAVPGKKLIALRTTDGHIRMLNPSTRSVVSIGGCAGYDSIAWCPKDNGLVASREHLNYSGDYGVWYVPINESRALEVYPPADSDFCANLFVLPSATRSFVVFGGGHYGLHVWDTTARQLERSLPSLANYYINAVCWIDDQRLFVSTTPRALDKVVPARLFVVRLGSGRLKTFQLNRGHHLRQWTIDSLAYSSASHRLALGRSLPAYSNSFSQRVDIINTLDNTTLTLPPLGSMSPRAFSRDGNELLLLSQRGTTSDCYVYNLRTNKYTLIGDGVTDASWL